MFVKKFNATKREFDSLEAFKLSRGDRDRLPSMNNSSGVFFGIFHKPKNSKHEVCAIPPRRK